MDFTIHCLLISGILVIANGDDSLISSILARHVVDILKNGESNLTGSDVHKLTLVEGGELGRSARSLVWKGIYNDKENVAVKISMDGKFMNKEMTVYNALNAVDEDHHVPKLYYHGKFYGNLYAIAISLFDGTLADYYTKRHEMHLSDADILYILMQTVKGLEYLSIKNVVHNDIKPQNLFYRGTEVFIGDFDLATVNGEQNRHCTEFFASRSYYANETRYAKDDLESLVYSLWFLTGVPLDKILDEKTRLPTFIYRFEGQSFFENLKKGKKHARSQLMNKCKHFKNKHVRGVFEDIINKEFFSSEPIPNYKEIIQIVAHAMKRIDKNQRASDWLSDGICSIFTLCEK